MSVPETTVDADWSRAPFPETLATLLAERGMSPQKLARTMRIEASSLHAAIDGRKEPTRAVLELAASTLDIAPHHFIEYRLATVVDALARDPAHANALFLESLPELERPNVDVSRFGNQGFAESVRALLAEEELTQGELAESIGILPSELSRMLNGKRRLHAEIIVLVAQALGVEPELFLEYRLALLGEWLRDHPDQIDALLDGLEPPVGLPPYRAWPVRSLPDPRHVRLKEVSRSLVEIIEVEGPVLVARVYRLRLYAAGIQVETRELRALLHRASHAAITSGSLIGENERPKPTQRKLVLRTPGTPAVRIRARGDRSIAEIPLAEIHAVIETSKSSRLHEPRAAVQNELFALYEVGQLRPADIKHIHKAITMRS